MLWFSSMNYKNYIARFFRVLASFAFQGGLNPTIAKWSFKRCFSVAVIELVIGPFATYSKGSLEHFSHYLHGLIPIFNFGFRWTFFFYTLDVCPSPPRLVHGSHDGNDFSNGRNVTYSCDPLYELEGSEVMTCLDGQWLGQIPVCRGN